MPHSIITQEAARQPLTARAESASAGPHALAGPANLDEALAREWLVTNGRGGYASASISQALTRRYHGLLVAAVDAPVQRYVTLAKLDATVEIDGAEHSLATNVYNGAVHPAGYACLETFAPGDRPVWRWRIGETVLEQTLAMIGGQDAVVVQYRLREGAERATLSVRPFGTSRHFHHLTSAAQMGDPTVRISEQRIELNWGEPGWWLRHNGAFARDADWYYGFRLEVEANRGFDCSQDLFTPGTITKEVTRDGAATLLIMAGTTNVELPSADWKSVARNVTRGAAPEACKRAALAHGYAAPLPGTAVDVSNIDAQRRMRLEELAGRLCTAALQFVVRRGAQDRTIIAGYPWFGDWGRDTFISLPGLCLATGHYADARRIIRTFAGHVDRGMIPNCFPSYGEPPVYNTCDATLWYVHAIDAYLRHTNDTKLLKEELFDVVADILDCHAAGTRHGIRVDADGLLAAGETGHALTWMDAMVDGRAVTPRIGKPVEINALWYNALCIGADMAVKQRDGIRAKAWCELAARCRRTFNDRFWNAARNCLYDVVDAEHEQGRLDSSLRPNQLLAISLTHPVLEPARWSAVVSTCERELLTPMGLRTLSRDAPGYRARYAGGPAARDEAYHQGTVWPWLIGPFMTAMLRARGGEDVDACAAWFDAFAGHLDAVGVGGVSEVADAEAPHAPGGCPWQAWSVAEPLRVLVEDLRLDFPTRG